MKFYLATNFNIKGKGDGQALARKLVAVFEDLTGDHCTAQWPFSEWHSKPGMGKTISVTDIMDLASADYLIAIPITGTARGCHVEIGLALGRDKPVYLYRPSPKSSPTGFDEMCHEFPENWKVAVNPLLNQLLVEELK